MLEIAYLTIYSENIDMASKVLKGQAFIQDDKLVQDQTVVSETGMYNRTEVLIDDIWDDLTSSETTAKSNSKKTYFYWTYKMTSIDDDSVEVDVMFECPKPKEGLFEEPYDPTLAENDWEEYWLTKYKKVADTYKDSYTIQPKEIIIPGTEYINAHGEVVKVDEIRTINSDLGDITNLLTLF